MRPERLWNCGDPVDNPAADNRRSAKAGGSNGKGPLCAHNFLMHRRTGDEDAYCGPGFADCMDGLASGASILRNHPCKWLVHTHATLPKQLGRSGTCMPVISAVLWAKCLGRTRSGVLSTQGPMQHKLLLSEVVAQRWKAYDNDVSVDI